MILLSAMTNKQQIGAHPLSHGDAVLVCPLDGKSLLMTGIFFTISSKYTFHCFRFPSFSSKHLFLSVYFACKDLLLGM